MLNAAVIGAGSMGKNHIRTYSSMQDAKIVAIADSDKKMVESAAKMYGCSGYTDHKEMMEKEKIDLVSVVVPTAHHHQVALDCIKKGIHVLVEKPIASTVKEAEEIISAAKERNVKLMVGHIERFNPAIIELKRRLDNNELGRVFKIDVNRVGPFPARVRDVGVVIDLAVHDLDIMRYLTNSEVKRISAEIERKIHSVKEDLVKALIRLENGTLCTLSVDWLTPTKIRKLYITGEKGMFVANYLNQNLYFYENAVLNGNRIDYSDSIRGVMEGRMTKFYIKKKEPLLSEIEHFVHCVANNRDPLVSGDDGLKALEIATQIIESYNESEK